MVRAESKVVEVDGLGPVLFEKSRRAKRPSILVRPFKGVRVAVPVRVSFARAEEFLWEHVDWARKHLANIRKVEQEHQSTLGGVDRVDRGEAGRVIVERLNCLARMHGFEFNRVTIRNQKTRWGSCSSQNNISLNVNLVKLKEELMDYVILHELVHTEEHNHSKRFWRRLDQFVGDAKGLDKELGKHRLRLL